MSTAPEESGTDPEIAPRFDHSALVVIDVQNDFVEGGASPVPGTRAVVPAIASLVRAYRVSGRPIVHVVRLYEGEDTDRVRRAMLASGAQIVRPGSPGSQVVPELLPDPGIVLDPRVLLRGDLQPLGRNEFALWKPRWSAFYRTSLEEQLRGRGADTVVIAGCNFPNCPRATLVDASERDFRVVLAADAVSGLQPWHMAESERIGAVSLDAAAIAAALRTPALSPSSTGTPLT